MKCTTCGLNMKGSFSQLRTTGYKVFKRQTSILFMKYYVHDYLNN